jgi:hypothetical protein
MAVFQRRKANTSTTVTEDTEAQQRIGGELTEAVSDDEAPSQFDDTPYEVAADRLAATPPDTSGWDSATEAAGDRSPVGALHDGGFTTEPVEPVGAVAEPAEPDELSPVGEDEPEPQPAGTVDEIALPEPAEQAANAGPGARRRGLRRAKVPA